MIWRGQSEPEDAPRRQAPAPGEGATAGAREEPGALAGDASVGEHVESVLNAAQRAAQDIRQDAQEWAQGYVEDTRRRADQVASQRINEISTLTDDLVARARAVAQQSDELVAALGDAGRRVIDSAQAEGAILETGEPAATGPEPPQPASAGSHPEVASPQPPPAAAASPDPLAPPYEPLAEEALPEPPLESAFPDEPELHDEPEFPNEPELHDEPAPPEHSLLDDELGPLDEPALASEPASPETAEEPASPPEPEPPATPASASSSAPVSEGARLLATQMAVAGSSREDVARRLREEFGIEDSTAILDEIGI